MTTTRSARGTHEADSEIQRPRRAPDIRSLIPELGLKEYWYPALLDRSVGGKPVGLKVCGEQLVFFRGADGEVKCLANVCPHRGGSLMHGDCHYPGTVSCPYHGWTFDGDGNVLAVLPEGPESKVPGKVKARAYPTRTLRGMVFVWMGEHEPAPIEEDLPPEFFTQDGLLLYAFEVWPSNWRKALDNLGDVHAPYVHRDSVRWLMQVGSLVQGPYGNESIIVNGKARKDGARRTGAGPRGVAKFERIYFPQLQGYWPKAKWRMLWAWATQWSARRRAKRLPQIDSINEWENLRTSHHLPSIVRNYYTTHMYTRWAVPIDADHTRQVYLHYGYANSWLGQLYEKIQYHVHHRWAMYTNFSVQDMKALVPQRYDEPENLSATDSGVVAWRRLLLQARGMDKVSTPEVLAAHMSDES